VFPGGRKFAWTGDIKLPHTPFESLRYVDSSVSGCKADSIWSINREDYFPDKGTIRLGVVDRGAVPLTFQQFPEVGEPESAVAVKNKIVRSAKPMTVAFGI
jgi:hypothetical protein